MPDHFNHHKDKFDYSAIANTMLEAFPEIGEQYAKEIRWISDTFRGQESRGQTLYFDRCFSDFLGRLLIEEHPDKVQIEKKEIDRYKNIHQEKLVL